MGRLSMAKLSKRKRKEFEKQRLIELQRKAEAKKRQCGKKKRYDTELEAYSSGKFAFRDGRYIGTYYCPQCNKWHITTKKRFDKVSAM
jgi:hypothetical protein